MTLEINSNINTTNCINGCVLFDDKSNYSYWEEREATSDEIYIVDFVNKNNLSQKKRVLHVGIGNSYVANKLLSYAQIDGITISNKEIKKGKLSMLKNYECFFLNKYSNHKLFENKLNNYDIIIDANIKSFACCEKAFQNLFFKYTKMLNYQGMIVTGKKGMNWSRFVKPVNSFSLKKFFYKKLKEYDGPKRNFLSIDECFSLAEKHQLKFNSLDKNIVYFKKLSK